MRCVSCGEDIPSKWVLVIEKNECPSCGGPIMTDDAISLREELAEALKKMPNDPQGITGWLLSNYKVHKIANEKPVEKFNRGSSAQEHQAQSNEDTASQFKVAKSPYDDYLARTGMKSKVDEVNASVASKRNRMAEMAANIANMDDPYGEPPVNVNASPNPQADQEDYAALQQMMTEASNEQKIPALPPSGAGGALSPEQVMMMQKQASAGPDIASVDYDGVVRSNVGYNDGELSAAEQQLINQTGEKGKQVVMNKRLKRIKAQEAVEGGGGSFTRSG